jgi:hypothetical protein
MKYQFIEDHRNTYPVQRMCAVLEVSSSGYYAWRDRAPSQRTQENRELAKHMQIIHDKARHTYGSPRIHAKLLKQGFQVSLGRVQRLMSAAVSPSAMVKAGSQAGVLPGAGTTSNAISSPP